MNFIVIFIMLVSITCIGSFILSKPEKPEQDAWNETKKTEL
jgi:preprotein translocase subunit YajC